MTDSRPLVVAVDVGGTRVKAALVAADGTSLAERVLPTPTDPAATLPDVVATLVAEFGAVAEPDGVGVVVPGLVDDVAGTAVWAANLGWRDMPLRALLQERLRRSGGGLPVAVGHDVRAGLTAEHRFGAARDCDNVLFVPLGTGIAAAQLCAGRVVLGSGWTGEIGHVVLEPEGPACGCGARGCLEAISSAGAIARAHTAATGERIDAAAVAARVRAGDVTAAGIWRHAVSTLARALAPVVATAGTERVVVGGGLVLAADTLLDPLRAALQALLPPAFPLEVVPAALGDRAGCLGAACLAHDLVRTR